MTHTLTILWITQNVYFFRGDVSFVRWKDQDHKIYVKFTILLTETFPFSLLSSCVCLSSQFGIRWQCSVTISLRGLRLSSCCFTKASLFFFDCFASALCTPRLSAESTALHYSNGSSDTYCNRGPPLGDAVCWWPDGTCRTVWRRTERKWNKCLKDKGLKINEDKTKVMCESFVTGTTQAVGNVKHPCSLSEGCWCELY